MVKKWPKNKVSDIRLSLNLKQSEFGEIIAEHIQRKSPFSYAAVSYWESCSDTMSLDIMCAICDIAHCSLEYLLGFSDRPFQVERCNDSISEMDGKCIITFTENYKEIGYTGLVNTEKRVIIFKNGYEMSFDDLDSKNIYKYESNMEIVKPKQLLQFYDKDKQVFALTIPEDSSYNSDGWYHYDINLGCCINADKNCLYLNDYYKTWIALF